MTQGVTSFRNALNLNRQTDRQIRRCTKRAIIQQHVWIPQLRCSQAANACCRNTWHYPNSAALFPRLCDTQTMDEDMCAGGYKCQEDPYRFILPCFLQRLTGEAVPFLMTGTGMSNAFLALVLAACKKNHATQKRVQRMKGDKRL
jgi:hypothetical protein